MTSWLLLAEGWTDKHPFWLHDLNFWPLIVFGLLALVVAKFARPAGAALKEREQKIVSDLRRAETMAEEIRQIRVRQAEERVRLKAQAEELFAEAGRDATRIKSEIVGRAEEESKLIAGRAEREIGLARQKIAAELWSTSAELSTETASKLIAGKASRDDHLKLIDEAIDAVKRAVGRSS